MNVGTNRQGVAVKAHRNGWLQLILLVGIEIVKLSL